MPPASARVRLILLLTLTVLLAAALTAHVSWLNGPEYWKWPWRRVPTLRVFPPMLLAVAPLFAAIWFRMRASFAIGLMMMSMLEMQIVAIMMPQRPASFNWLIYCVESPTNLSYFSDADRTMDFPTRELLARYPEFMPQFSMHSQEKPPGPILFFRAILAIFGSSDRTALIAGLIIGVLATLAIPATHFMIKTLTDDSTAALLGSCFVGLAPGFVLHFPQMDQLYPIITCLLIIFWARTLATHRLIWAAAFGLMLAGACFIVYHFLVLGAFLLALTMYHISGDPGQRTRSAAKCIVCALGGFAGSYVVLGLIGFNPIATFTTALHNQAQHLKDLYRPYPKTIWDDLADFALGAGWIGWLLTIYFFANARSHPNKHIILAALCIGQIILLAVTGVMQTETARTWCFLLPLLAVPVGLELSTWPRSARFVAIISMWLILCLVGQNMKFIFKPAEQPQRTSSQQPQ